MDDVVAVRVEADDGTDHYFVTWGRIQERVDLGPLSALVLRHASTFIRPGKPVRASVCHALSVAAASGRAPYFYEALLLFARRPIPSDDEYAQWRAARASAMEQGFEIDYCGDASRFDQFPPP